MDGQAFVSRRIMTPEGIRPGAILVRDGRISGIVPVDQAPTDPEVHDFGNAVIFPGLVDSHVHINDPGRAEWEGFETATRAAAAGGYTTLVDMPLNCLPPTATVAALAAKREAAAGRCWVDWLAWGGVVSDNQADIEALAAAGVPGFKCFLIHPGIDGFTMVTEAELRAALPHVARTGLPLLVHAELPGPVNDATERLQNQNEDADWSRYSTYLQSRPEEAELAAIRLLLSLCRDLQVPLAHCSSLGEFGAWSIARCASRGSSGQRGNLSTLFTFLRGRNSGRSHIVQVRAADSLSRKPRKVVARIARRDHRPGSKRSFALSAGHEAAQ